MSHTSASNSITIRMELDHSPGLLAKVMTEVGDLGGNTGAIDIVRVNKGRIIRDITIDTSDPEQAEAIQQAINAIEGVEIIHVSDRTFLLHLGGLGLPARGLGHVALHLLQVATSDADVALGAGLDADTLQAELGLDALEDHLPVFLLLWQQVIGV